MNLDLPLMLIILDGWGYDETANTNAIKQATTPAWDQLWSACPHTLLSGSGLDVGLPNGQMGNSEVGHMTLGSGRVIYQDLTRINKAIADKSFFSNQVLLAALNKAKQQRKAVHVLGLLSPGGIHSHEQQIAAMLQMATQNGIDKLYLHAFLDGRDTPPQSAANSILLFEPYIASITGRFYAMDRDKRSERTEATIKLLTQGIANYQANSALQGLELAYARGETDEFVQPTQIKPIKIETGDVVIFMNFRSDRARQLSYALTTINPPLMGEFVTLTEYDPQLSAKVAFPKQPVNNTLSEILQQNNMTQLHIAETEKYAHVTFFFNAGKEHAVTGEERILIPSPQIATYDLKPEMSALAITEKLLSAIKNKTHDVIICNFANADMVGHTGKMPATIKAIEALDACLGQISQALHDYGGQALITADHGNAEIMWDEKHQQPHTAHTTNLVPLVYLGRKKIVFKNNPPNKPYGLQDVAPTMLKLLNLPQPNEMTGSSLIVD